MIGGKRVSVISQEEVDDAVRAGAIDPVTAASLRAFVERRDASAIPDEEQFLLLTSFNDVFVAVAAVIALGAVASLTAPIVMAAAALVLALHFTKAKRMALPSIVLALAFIGGVAMGAGDFGIFLALPTAYLHWRWFKVPIVPAAGYVVASFVLNALLPSDLRHEAAAGLSLVIGLAGFAWALWWDRSDRERRTRRSDVAFWLHLASAGMIVHPLFVSSGLFEMTAGAAQGAAVIAVYALLTLLALAIDRRAILVTALFYLLWATGRLMMELGGLGTAVPLTALVIGSALLLLSALWSRVRSALVLRLPQAWQEQLPPASPSRRSA